MIELGPTVTLPSGQYGTYTGAGRVVSPGLTYPNLRTAGNAFQTAGRDNGALRAIFNPIDTVGAGDGFAAGYLDAYVAGRDPQDCIDQAAAVGALATTRRGDLTAMPTRIELDVFLAAN